MKLSGKKVTVVGLGKSGFAAAKFLLERKAVVRVTDGSAKQAVLENASYLRSLGAEVETGRHTEEFVIGSDLVVTSPGVSKESLPLRTAKKKKIRVISEIELAYFFCKGKIAAVTGSNGKTTTCNLIHRLLTDAGKKSVLCGNVGYSFLDAVAEIDAKTLVVLELSSFQLEDSPAFRPAIAAVLNISPNHLDRHKTVGEYVAAKEKIFANQKKSDTLILNYDDRIVRKMAKKTESKVLFYSLSPLDKGFFVENNEIKTREKGSEKILLRTDSLKLKGSHNLQNIMAASAVARLLGVSQGKMQKSLDHFKTLEHRIEPLGEVRGVKFVNDSKSTTVDSTKAAIESVEGPMVLIAGGRDKGVPFAEIEELVLRRAKKMILYGEAREKIAAAWKNPPQVSIEKDFKKAVLLAYEEASPGDTILLSPMCTSFDQFSSYEHRGETFKKVFEEIRHSWTR